MFERIGAVAVYVTDKERAKKFYTGVLGFEVAHDIGPDLCFLRSANGRIDIYLEGGMQQRALDNRTCRLSFFLHTGEPAAVAFGRLKAAGVKLLQGAPEAVSDDTACFQFEDPDGNILEACGSA